MKVPSAGGSAKRIANGKGVCREAESEGSLKANDTLKEKIKTITARSNGWSLDYRRFRFQKLVVGWVNYFKLADMKSALKEIDEWCRRRIRMVYWKQWKKNRTKYRALMKLGIPKQKAWEWANSRKAYWRIAWSWVLTRALSNAKLKELDWTFFSEKYLQVKGCT